MDIQYLERDDKPKLAYVYSKASDAGQNLPIVMFCCGFRSDMMGTKATYFEALCRRRGQGYLRFDYSGHGMSAGDFRDGTIGSWLGDALDIFDALIDGPVIMIGSSMGGWIGLLLAQLRFAHIKGFIGIAAAPDFTVRLHDEELNDSQRAMIRGQGYVEIPNEYSDEPYIFTARLIEDGADHLILDTDKTHHYPITLFHGLKDITVPSEVPRMIKTRYSGGPLDIVYIEDGDHSLSRPQDLAMIESEIIAMSQNSDNDQL